MTTKKKFDVTVAYTATAHVVVTAESKEAALKETAKDLYLPGDAIVSKGYEVISVKEVKKS